MNRNEKDYHPFEVDFESSDLENIELKLLLEGIYRFYGFDFRNYNVSSIRRRIWHRIQIEKLESISELQAKVLHDRTMMEKLHADFLINVTEMYRDPVFFKTFRTKVIPQIRDLPAIRIWHAGCSTGEEAYSMAILLHEGGLLHKARIYATDMNEKVLNQAKTGRFPLAKMKKYTGNYVKSGGTREFSEYYTAEQEEVKFKDYLSEVITFAQHNLVTDSSFNEFHIVICRNVLIYFDRELQNRVLQLMYESLSPSGYLGLGSRETLSYSKFDQYYKEITNSDRIYRKIR